MYNGKFYYKYTTQNLLRITFSYLNILFILECFKRLSLRFVLLCISHTAVHLIIDFFSLYCVVALHAKGDNLENGCFATLTFWTWFSFTLETQFPFGKLYEMANNCLRQRLGIENLSRGWNFWSRSVLTARCTSSWHVKCRSSNIVESLSDAGKCCL